jgi:hypothetical protein
VYFRVYQGRTYEVTSSAKYGKDQEGTNVDDIESRLNRELKYLRRLGWDNHYAAYTATSFPSWRFSLLVSL